MDPTLIAIVVVVALVLIVMGKTAVVVPQQNAYVVEFPFVEKIAYRHNLKSTRSILRNRSALLGTTSRSEWTGFST